MKKHLTILLGMALMALIGVATGADTTVRILHLQDNPQFLELWKQIGAEFEKQNPGVKIDWQYRKRGFQGQVAYDATVQGAP